MRYQPKRELWEAQQRGLKKMLGRECFALLMAMRTGKSPTLLAEFGELEASDLADDMLVIAPAGAYRTWAEAFREHASDDLQKRTAVHVWQSGSSKVKMRDQFLKHDGPRLLLVNVEALSRAGDARAFVVKYLKRRPHRTYTGVDESTCIKNNTKRTRFVNHHVKSLSRYRRIASGLVTPRDPLDLFFQFEFLDPQILGHQRFVSFRNEHAIMVPQWFGGRLVQVVAGFKPGTDEKLRALIEPHSFRVPFNPLVPSTFSRREVQMTKEQQKHYEEVRDRATTQLASGDHVTATVVVAQITRLHQILCGHVADEEGKLHEISELRSGEVMKMLEDYSGKAIVWCSYDYNVRKLSAMLKEEYGEESTARFWGGNVATREEEKDRFRSDPACRWMVATPDSGGKGQTWDVADLAIYFSNRDNLEHRDQSEQRTMGVKKTRGVDNVDIVCPGTVDEKIIYAIRNKINMSSAINGDNYREWLI